MKNKEEKFCYEEIIEVIMVTWSFQENPIKK
jgi:hypothetical protein